MMRRSLVIPCIVVTALLLACGLVSAFTVTRQAAFVPSAYDLHQPYNVGRTANFSIVIRHGVVFASGIAARITDGNGLAVPYAPVNLRLVWANSTSSPSNVTAPNATNATSALVPSTWITGTMGSADGSGFVNLTMFTAVACFNFETVWAAFVCPEAVGGVGTVVVCSDAIKVSLYPNPSIVQLIFSASGKAASTSNGPTATAGAAVLPFQVRLTTSCNTPLLLPQPPLVSGEAIARVSISGVGIVGFTTQNLQSDSTMQQSYATFDSLQATILPGASEVSYQDVPPTSTIPTNVSLEYRYAANATSVLATVGPSTVVPFASVLNAWTEIETTISPASEASTVPVSCSIMSLTSDQFSFAVDLLTSTGGAPSVGTIPTTTSDLFSLAAMNSNQLDASGDASVNEYQIRDFGGDPFAFVYNASAFTNPATLGDVPVPSGWTAAGNNTLFCQGQYDLEEVPRGMMYALTKQAGFITSFGVFAVSVVDTVRNQQSQLFVMPFIIGPLPSLASTLHEVLTCYPSVGLLAKGYSANPAVLQLSVTGLPDTKTGTARRIVSIAAFLNPEIAYISAMVQVCDCTLDHGLPMDLGLHPLQFAIGANQLDRYQKGALVGNAIIIVLAFVVPFGIATQLRRVALASEASRAERLVSVADHIFPHLGINAAIALYPGVAFSAYALLPYLPNTFMVLLWCIVGVVWLVAFPLTILRIAVKMSPNFREVDVHAITRSWIFKIVVPLGDYEGTHVDMIRFRAAFHDFRGDYKWFHIARMSQWLLTCIFAANFQACTYRFLVPLATQVLMFFFVVARAPFITAYHNVASVLSSVVIIVGLSILFWSSNERFSTEVLSSWAIALTFVTLALRAADLTYVYFQDRYVLGAARGHLDEEFLVVSEESPRKAKRRHRSGHMDDDPDDDEFVDAEFEAKLALDDGLRVTTVNIDEDRRELNPFDLAPPPAVPDPKQQAEIKRKEAAQRLLDEVLGNTEHHYIGGRDGFEFDSRSRAGTVKPLNATSAPASRSANTNGPSAAFADWADRLNPREQFEAEQDVRVMRRVERGETVIVPFEDKRIKPRDTLGNPKAAAKAQNDREVVAAFDSRAQRERQRQLKEEAEIDALLRRKSRPTAEPTHLYGKQFAPRQTFGYQKRVAAAMNGARVYDGVANPEDADDGLDGEDATHYLDGTEASDKVHRAALVKVLTQPVMPPRKLNPGMEALLQQRRQERITQAVAEDAAREASAAHDAMKARFLRGGIPTTGGQRSDVSHLM